jgi:predicted NACHT family NTPase
MERSRKLALTDWTQANNALHQYFLGNKSQLADHLGMSRTTVTAFFKSEPVREAEFRKICFALRLNWQEASTFQANAPQPKNKTDSLQQIREHCRQKIFNQYSGIRLLSGEEIGVDQLYVDVWVLNRSPRTFQVSEDKLLKTFDLRNDRLGLGDRIKRNSGFEIANANPNLLILGKPGAGKTTFLKHLAVDWCKGEFQPDRIAIFIELRRIRDRQWQLLDAIGKELGLDEGHQIRALKQQIGQLKQSLSKSLEEKQRKDDEIKASQERIKAFQKQLEALSLQILLKEGKLLVLMDGLDEVPTNELRRNVQDQLREMAEHYVNNRWILTCRTQIIESIPVGFTSVEVADFSPEQVQQFVQNWFQASGQSDAEVVQQWGNFDHAVSRNSALKEMTVTPVLLSLMCLVLHDEGEMPFQMTALYKKGIRLLLEKWNNAKAIEGWAVGSDTYRQLSVEQKETLLIEIAARKFENPENFVLFDQEEIVAYIDEFLRRNNFTRRIARFLQLDNSRESIMVLKAVEAQHGLLIERADELWSFSHLTFQEYFTVQWLTQLLPEQLADKIANSRWQQVVEQLVKSQQPADQLLRLIKRSIDRSISGELTLNQFLTWVLQKSGSIRTNDKPAALRVLYFALARTLARTLDLDLALALALALDLNRDLDLDLNRDLDLDLNRARDSALALARDLDLDLALGFNLDLNLDLNSAFNLNLDFTLARNRDRNRDLALALTLNLALAPSLDHELVVKLEELKTQLPLPGNWQHFQQWQQVQGQQWLERLRHIMIQHRNIGHNWQFNEQQQQQLQRYYNANHFLVKLMKIDGAVSKEVRAEIEDSLLLPWDELQRRQPDVYRQPQSTSLSPVRVFIAYSQEDEDLREALDHHLANLKRQGKIQSWHRGAIEAGAEWDAAIKQQLEMAQIILLLVSAYFVASDHCYDLLQQSLQRHHAGTARVIPIILRPTDLQDSSFSHLSPLPTDGVPITRWSNRDEAFLNVVEGIRGAIEALVR